MALPKGSLGIMTTERDAFPPFSNARYYRQLSLFGTRMGLLVYVFSPLHINWTLQRVPGYTWNRNTGSWEKQLLPLPDLVYDRFFYSRNRQFVPARTAIRKLRKWPNLRFLGFGLPDKYRVHRLLSGDDTIAPHLPELCNITRLGDVKAMLAKYGDLVLKPRGGSQGRGIFRLTAMKDRPGSFRVKGRDWHNRFYSRHFGNPRDLAAWLLVRLKHCPHTAEPFRHLTTRSGAPYDIRTFMQKNRRGRWQWIGMAARIGQPGKLTSNLHGGGKAEQAWTLLQAEFGDRAGKLADKIRSLSMHIARVLERNHGRLVELGADFGIEPSGDIWLLEVNSRPGRSIFDQIGDRAAGNKAISNPIHYACYLRERQLGG